MTQRTERVKRLARGDPSISFVCAFDLVLRERLLDGARSHSRRFLAQLTQRRRVSSLIREFHESIFNQRCGVRRLRDELLERARVVV